MPIHRRPGRTLYRYLVLEMVFPTLYTLGGLTLVILTRELIGYSEMVINRGLALADVGALAVYQMLPVIAQMLPFAVLVGGLVALGRLGSDRELLMLEASGVSSPRILGPVMLFAGVMSVIAFFLSVETAPWASRSLDAKLEEIGRRNPGTTITAGGVQRFGEWMLQAREVSPRGDHMRGVFLWMPSVGETVFARSGKLISGAEGENQVILENGSLILDPRETARELRFDRMTTELPSSSEPLSRNVKDQLTGATLAELVAMQRSPALKKRRKADSGLQLHRRFALPAATIVFGFLIVPLFLARAHFSRSGGGVLGLLATLSYYGLAQLGDSLVYDGTLSASMGAWLPNFTLAVLAGVMVARMTRMTAFGRHSDRPSSRHEVPEAAPGEPVRLRARPRPLERYVALRFLQMAGICFAVVLTGYMLIDILERLQWMGKYGATLTQVMSYYLARIPLLASRVVPMSLLVATALTVSVLAAQGELMGMRASGIPAPRALLPILVICSLIAPAYFVLNNEVLPETNALASYFKAEVKNRRDRSEGLGAWFRDGHRFFQADHLDPKDGTARNITIFELGEDGLPTAREDARSARHIGGGVWLLRDSVRVERLRSGRLSQVEGSAHARIGEAIQADVDTRHLSVGDLRDEILEVEGSGLDATHYHVDLIVKLASPVACIILPALALFFAVGGPPHPSSALTLVLSAVVAVAYVLLTGVGASLGYGGAVAPWVAGGAPTALFGVVAAYLGLRLRGFGQSL
ncbi:MAG: LptF/LptG family permease [Myxococcota bacterium]|nr:LptF/LptG family permease [Myxococcota bacterium]